MYIEDEELRTLYRDASKDHLDKLEAGFLQLEQQPDDLTILKDLLRATHSLKGDSRMLGVQDAETLTHQLEDLLSSVEQGQREVTPPFCDCLYQGLDAIRKIAHEAVTGNPSNVSVFHVLAQLMNAGDVSAPESEVLGEYQELAETDLADHERMILSTVEQLERQLESAENEAASDQTTSDVFALEEAPAHPEIIIPRPVIPETAIPEKLEPAASLGESYQIDTVRVEATKLDTLMTQAGELAVTKRRITRRMDDVDKILSFWEGWVRDNLVDRLNVGEQVPQGTESLQSLQQITEDRLDQLGDLLKQLRTNAYEDSAQLETLSNDLESGILKLRQLPLSSMFSLFPRMVRDLAKEQGKTINLVIEGGDIQADKRILEEMKAPLTHLIRNAIDHGIEAPSERIAMDKPPKATVWLKAHQRGSLIDIEVVDDGRGLSLESIKRTAVRRGVHTEAALAKMSREQIQDLIFMPGFSTRSTVTEISGRGVGLDVVRVNVERLKGAIQVNSNPAQGCTFRFTLNTSLATASALIVAANETSYAIPVESVEVMMRVERQDIFTLEGSPTINFQGQPLSIAWLSELLQMPVSVTARLQRPRIDHPSISCVVLKVGAERLGVFVDELIDQQDIVLKPHSKLLKRVRNISGATILGTGEVCMVLSPQDLIRSVSGTSSKEFEPMFTEWEHTITKPRVLLVEDSMPIRTQVRRILEGAGYQVTIAVDGLDGLDKLQQEGMFDAVVSDVEMPNLDGLGLTSRIREETKYEDLPIVLVTTLAEDDDKRRGADAGANAYITKGDFDQSLLIDTLRRLI
ncbi:hybrid sensor histidine kinase/response regulator [Leptothoe sp. PORK10 BA2]|uniref:hybrid sensor histidine kinase/response regulator n=1 Tax=Leptothoe sp. PORK10 BA2 TaxID=3110254 RepID=UPI002B1F707E|nr:hybrid sensor histidine kinase/response regulator [Leptothoe sp. PORK10 BA2]MEA5462517.1 hybrid sensor histidine kinase/response regulator [Leptothoe sp. PORK10 BA2]